MYTCIPIEVTYLVRRQCTFNMIITDPYCNKASNFHQQLTAVNTTIGVMNALANGGKYNGIPLFGAFALAKILV